jgi:hypothetical protein
MASITLITRDEIIFGAPRAPFGEFVKGDNGSVYNVVCHIGDTLYVAGPHGNLARVTRTGNATVSRVSDMGEVRARLDFATDTGDAAGTISFGDGEHIGGTVSRRLLPIMVRSGRNGW